MNMKIKGYTIGIADENNYTVTKKNTVIGYYNSIAAAVKEVARRVANNGADLEEWLKRYDEVLGEFKREVARFTDDRA